RADARAGRKGVRGRRGDPFQGAARADAFGGSRARPGQVRERAPRGLRHPALGRPSNLPPVGRRRRHRNGEHARLPRGRHRSNTPRQVLRYGAFGKPVPQFAHVPLILGPDKKRLSKRHGATSVMEYPRLGYLPEAMVNFLALLGWNPGGDRELLSRDELISLFTLEGISGGNPVFNTDN